jgi:hypothetical protein
MQVWHNTLVLGVRAHNSKEANEGVLVCSSHWTFKYGIELIRASINGFPPYLKKKKKKRKGACRRNTNNNASQPFCHSKANTSPKSSVTSSRVYNNSSFKASKAERISELLRRLRVGEAYL